MQRPDRLRARAAGLSALLVTVAVSAAAAPVPVVITGDPVGPAITTAGQGLCTASAISMSPATDFGTFNPQTYNGGINSFMEAHVADRVSSTLTDIFDLSNNNATGLRLSYGDFTNSMPGTCQIGGCPFYVNDTTTSFATRFRGFINITSALARIPIHFGFYADDAVSFQIFDNQQNSYQVVTRPPQLGAPTWRTTNEVTFNQPGLYPIEILYVEIVEHAALEMSLFTGAFTDYELPANQMGSTSLQVAGFSLLAPSVFFQTVDGTPAYPNVTTCSQCNRQFAGNAGNNGCGAAYYCNEAAVCAPCDTSLFCGPSCSPCGGASPFCLNLNGAYTCVPCRDDADCPNMRHCDPNLHVCQECEVAADCSRGNICDAHKCVPCGTPDSCAGSSCNCCPTSAPLCSPLAGDTLPSCVQCASDADCKSGQKCDTEDGTCVATLPGCNTSDKCGPQCVRCPSDRPYCEGGQVCVQCRSDVECGPGTYCISGECDPCATDRHCGDRCSSCAGDAPFCLSTDGTSSHSTCVRCLVDADCHGGHCTPATHLCDAGCAMSCAPGNVCNGASCVACYADSQCCGGSCELTTGTCSTACVNSGSCLGTEHCSEISQSCVPGRRNPDDDPQGGGFCSCIPSRLGGRAPNAGGGTGGLLALALLGMALVMRRRSGR